MSKTLPKLHPKVRCFKGKPDAATGEPTLTLYDPAQNKYFKISWAESEIVARLSLFETKEDVLSSLRNETSIDASIDDITAMIEFLDQNGLTLASTTYTHQKKAPLWKKILHGYLSFSVPVCHPQRILDKTYPFVSFLFEPLTTKIMTVSLIVLGLWTLTKGQEFMASIPGELTPELVVQMVLIFAGIKIAHEWAHAYTATKYTVPVPHMGINFIVLFPVLYTETSAAWRLTSNKDRLEIALAGIRMELMIATIALFIWNMSTIGSPLHILSFMILGVSLLSSLAINLNPLMRFDGYYILSDALGIDNLQHRACHAAKRGLRKSLFGLENPHPEEDPQTERFLTLFGIGLITYRFFLFSGIAYLVYTHVFQPLGTLLAAIEIWFFILVPVLNEMRVWIKMKSQILDSTRTRITLAFLVSAVLLFLAPIHTSITAPAIEELQSSQTLYPPAIAEITDVKVTRGEQVVSGQKLIVLHSLSLEKEWNEAKQKLIRKLAVKRTQRLSDNGETQNPEIVLEEEISALRKKIVALESRKEQLTLRAPFSGIVSEMADGLQKGRTLSETTPVLTIQSGKEKTVIAYVTADEKERLKETSLAVFIPNHSPLSSYDLTLEAIEDVSSEMFSEPELASSYGGPVLANSTSRRQVTTAEPLYKARFTIKNQANPDYYNGKSIGWVKMKGKVYSPLFKIMKETLHTLGNQRS